MTAAYRAGFADGVALLKEAGFFGAVGGYFGRLAGSSGIIRPLEEAAAKAKAGRGEILGRLESMRASGAPGFEAALASARPELRSAAKTRIRALRGIDAEKREVFRTRALTAGVLLLRLALGGMIVNSFRNPNEKRWESFNYETDDRD